MYKEMLRPNFQKVVMPYPSEEAPRESSIGEDTSTNPEEEKVGAT